MSEMMNAAGPATAAGTFKATGAEYAANVLKGLGVAYNVQMLRAGGNDSAQGLANEFGVGFAVSLAGEREGGARIPCVFPAGADVASTPVWAALQYRCSSLPRSAGCLDVVTYIPSMLACRCHHLLSLVAAPHCNGDLLTLSEHSLHPIPLSSCCSTLLHLLCLTLLLLSRQAGGGVHGSDDGCPRPRAGGHCGSHPEWPTAWGAHLKLTAYTAGRLPCECGCLQGVVIVKACSIYSWTPTF
jgi:hypothetical protein